MWRTKFIPNRNCDRCCCFWAFLFFNWNSCICIVPSQEEERMSKHKWYYKKKKKCRESQSGRRNISNGFRQMSTAAGHWTLIQNRNGETLCPPPPGSELSNRFTVLEELCIFISSPPELSPNRPPGMLLRNWLTREDPVLPRPCSRCSPNENSREHVPASQLPSASTLIVTDSIVSDVKKRLAKTVWFPGAKGRFLTDKLMTILNSDPHAEAVVIHVGRNNIPLQQSELLKQVNDSSTCVLISDPLPAIKRGMGRLHRLLSLNTLIQSKNLVDNLNLFWTHQDFLKMDGIHPIFLGSLILTDKYKWFELLLCETEQSTPVLRQLLYRAPKFNQVFMKELSDFLSLINNVSLCDHRPIMFSMLLPPPDPLFPL